MMENGLLSIILTPPRILAVLVTCLDSFLYLETQYSFLQALCSLQRDNAMEDRCARAGVCMWIGGRGEASHLHISFLCLLAFMAISSLSLRDFIIIDACSVERNRILVSCYFTGGPSERRLPPHCITQVRVGTALHR